MPKLRVHSFSISLDGYGAGPNQSLSNPLGVGGGALHKWAFATRTFRKMHGGRWQEAEMALTAGFVPERLTGVRLLHENLAEDLFRERGVPGAACGGICS